MSRLKEGNAGGGGRGGGGGGGEDEVICFPNEARLFGVNPGAAPRRKRRRAGHQRLIGNAFHERKRIFIKFHISMKKLEVF